MNIEKSRFSRNSAGAVKPAVAKSAGSAAKAIKKAIELPEEESSKLEAKKEDTTGRETEERANSERSVNAASKPTINPYKLPSLGSETISSTANKDDSLKGLINRVASDGRRTPSETSLERNAELAELKAGLAAERGNSGFKINQEDFKITTTANDIGRAKELGNARERQALESSRGAGLLGSGANNPLAGVGFGGPNNNLSGNPLMPSMGQGGFNFGVGGTMSEGFGKETQAILPLGKGQKPVDY